MTTPRFDMSLVVTLLLASLLALMPQRSSALNDTSEYVLGAGDIIRVTVFQNPDLTVEARVTENGIITYPLLGQIELGGMTVPEAERKIAFALRDGGFVLKPQVNIFPAVIRGTQVAVLGYVNRPGRYPLDTLNTKVSEILALAGGITAIGSDTVVLTGVRDGKFIHTEIDLPAIFLRGQRDLDIRVQGGDVLYVHRAPQLYVYGEVVRPGPVRLERDMTVLQALAAAGGPNSRGSLRGLKIHRRDPEGNVQQVEPDLNDSIQADDVVYVRESLF